MSIKFKIEAGPRWSHRFGTRIIFSSRRIFASSRASRHASGKVTGLWVVKTWSRIAGSARQCESSRRLDRQAYQTGVRSPWCQSGYRSSVFPDRDLALAASRLERRGECWSPSRHHFRSRTAKELGTWHLHVFERAQEHIDLPVAPEREQYSGKTITGRIGEVK